MRLNDRFERRVLMSLVMAVLLTVPVPAAEPTQPASMDWERRINIPAIGSIFIRPVKQDDEKLFREFLDHVTPEDLRLRFFASMRHVEDKLITQLTHPDFSRAMVLVAVEEATQHVIGVVRLHWTADKTSAEYAVLVRSALKGQGLGWALMRLIIDYALQGGIHRIEGQVLAENTMMLQMCRELGFGIEMGVNDPDVKLVHLQLNDVLKAPTTIRSGAITPQPA